MNEVASVSLYGRRSIPKTRIPEVPGLHLYPKQFTPRSKIKVKHAENISLFNEVSFDITLQEKKKKVVKCIMHHYGSVECSFEC